MDALTKDALLARFGDDAELLVEIVNIFFEDHPKQLDEIVSALRAGDGQRLGRAAHTLKGSVSNFGADGARSAAQELERMGKQGQLENAEAAHALLLRELDGVTRALRTIVRQLAA